MPKVDIADTQSGGATIQPGDPLVDLKTSLDDMIKSHATYSINKSSGTLSVTGNYEAIKITDKLIQDFHSIYDKAIKLELHIYEVALADDNQFGIDYSFLKNEVVGNLISPTMSFATNNTVGLDTAVNSFAMNKYSGTILSTSTASSTPGESSTTTTAPSNTQGIIFKYLNKYGRTTVLTKPTLGTINNLSVRLNITDSKDYVYSLNQTSNATTTTGVSATTSSSTPEIKTVDTGYTLILHPKIEGEFIKVIVKNSSSTLNALTPYVYPSNGSNQTIYLKDISSRDFSETVKVKEGEIAIIGGYMYDSKSSDKNGMPYVGADDSSFDALTSGKSKVRNRKEIVITISAKVI